MKRLAIAVLLATSVIAPALAQSVEPPRLSVPAGSGIPPAGAGPGNLGAPVPGMQSRGIDLYTALRMYARHTHMSIYIDPAVPNRRVVYDVRNGSDSDVLGPLLTDLKWVVNDKIMVVTTPQRLWRYKHGNSIETVPVPPAKLQTLATSLPKLFDGLVVIPDEANKAIILQGASDDIDAAKNFIANHATLPTKDEIIGLNAGVDAATIVTEINGTTASLPVNGGNFIRPLLDTNEILVGGTEQYRAQMRDQIKLLDRQPAQVWYTASIIEITPGTDVTNRGISLGPITIGRAPAATSAAAATTAGATSAAATNVGATSGGGLLGTAPIGQISASLNALASHGTARLLQRATLVATNAKEQRTRFGSEIPVTVTDPITGIPSLRTIDTGIELRVTPIIGTNGIKTSVDASYKAEAGQAAGGYPILADRNIVTDFFTRDGETILIGGLYADDHQMTREDAPPFSYIPLIGSIFKNRNETSDHSEIVILITPNRDNGGRRGPDFDFASIPSAYKSGGIAPQKH
jgi:type II secretory pathway component GspD/PulD (secretin)